MSFFISLNSLRRKTRLQEIWGSELDFFLKKVFKLSEREFIDQIGIPNKKRVNFFSLIKISYFTWLKKKNYPWEYIFKETFFLKEKFFISPKAFIPRPETEELLHLIIKKEKKKNKKRILELGTGSGVIAISLKKAFPLAEVVAIDISKKALNVARKNAKLILGGDKDIKFIGGDAFSKEINQHFQENPFDIVVTNPPYVGEREKHLMSLSAIQHEPKKALFSGEFGLDFFLKLVPLLSLWLRKEGRFYAEMGFNQSDKVLEIFGFLKKKKITRDMFGKNRFFLAKK